MRTTLTIADTVLRKARQLATERGVTLSALVGSALRSYLDEAAATPSKLPPLPTWDGGGLLIDISNRDALEEALEGGPDGKWARLYGRRGEQGQQQG